MVRCSIDEQMAAINYPYQKKPRCLSNIISDERENLVTGDGDRRSSLVDDTDDAGCLFPALLKGYYLSRGT